MKRIKKWNWSLFLFVLLVAELGALSNKSCPDISCALLLGLAFGLPAGLLWAYMARND